MKKLLLAALVLLAASSLVAAPVLVEAYQEGTITLPGDKRDTVTVVELSFSVDTSCYVQFTAGGLTSFQTKMLLELDGNYLFPAAIVQGSTTLSALVVYTCLITPGEHTVRFKEITLISGPHLPAGYGNRCCGAAHQRRRADGQHPEPDKQRTLCSRARCNRACGRKWPGD